MVNDDLGSIAGLPPELGIGEDLARAEQVVRIRTDTRRYGKAMTIVEGFDTHVIDVGELASELKHALATGGTTRGDRIELQGDQREKLRKILEAKGFTVES